MRITTQASGQASRTTSTFGRGRVNHVQAESAREASNVVIGTFLVNNVPAIVLFDSGVSYTFISRAFMEQHGLDT